MIGTGALHQMIGRGPVAVTIEQRADNSAVQNAGKRFVFRLGLPLSHNFAVLGKTSDPQTIAIRRTATPARISRSVLFLKRLLSHRTRAGLNLKHPLDPDISEASGRRKGIAAGSVDCCRAARSRARTNRRRVKQQTAACSTPA